MKRKYYVIIVIIALLAAAVWNHWRNRPTRKDVIQRVFATQKNLDVFLAATEITAQRLHRRSNDYPYKLSSYELGEKIPLASAQVQEIRNLFQMPESYRWDHSAKSCIIDYAVLLTFRSDQNVVRIALCYHCKEFGVFAGENDDEGISGGDFDLMQKPLVAFAKSIFPNDPEIQALK